MDLQIITVQCRCISVRLTFNGLVCRVLMKKGHGYGYGHGHELFYSKDLSQVYLFLEYALTSNGGGAWCGGM